MNYEYIDKPVYSKTALELVEWAYEVNLKLLATDDKRKAYKLRSKVIHLLKLAEIYNERWLKYNGKSYVNGDRWVERKPLNQSWATPKKKIK